MREGVSWVKVKRVLATVQTRIVEQQRHTPIPSDARAITVISHTHPNGFLILEWLRLIRNSFGIDSRLMVYIV